MFCNVIQFRCLELILSGSSISNVRKLWLCRYTLSGEAATHRRRDQRRGRAAGRVELTPSGLVVTLHWKDPYAGYSRELFQLVSPMELHVPIELHCGQKVVKYTVRYRKVHD
jgi:hypothetical protein